jgi:uncharacterized protein YlxP (DUF503 family)
MFVCVARVTLDIPASGSLKAKRQVLRRVSDRVKAKFNVSLAEVEDNDAWQRGTLAMSVVGNDRRFVNEQMDKIFHYIDEMYVAPVLSRELEILSFNEQLFQTHGDASGAGGATALEIPKGERSLAEAEGLGDWETRHERKPPPPRVGAEPKSSASESKSAKAAKKLSLEEARAKARRLRNPRDWEKP